jgi:heterodisulfide reductase subunit A-like polyferredoxin
MLASGVSRLLGASLRQQPRKISMTRSNLASIESAVGVSFAAEHDIIVVGSGAAGSASALSAAANGCSDVLMLEKDKKIIGGTTAKSGGIFWIPNNPIMQEQGLVDKKEEWVGYAAW